MRLIWKTLLRGAIVLLPALITLWLLLAALIGLDNLGVSAFRFFGWQEPWLGAGVLLIVALMFISGSVLRIDPVKWLYRWIERLFMQAPVIKTIYSAIRDFVRLMDKDNHSQFKQTVLVDVTGIGQVVGFVTADHLPTSAKINGDVARVPVYLPMSYMVGGYTLLVPRERITHVDWSFEDAMRYVMTAGVSGSNG